MNNLKILIYDENNISYKVGYCASIDVDCGTPIDAIIGNYRKCILPMSSVLTCQISNYEELNNIELDETTMKRIAKYNKEIDIKKLDKEIEEKKEKIQRLESILEDREKRVDMLKKYIAEIYDINIKEDENDDDDYGDCDW